MRTEREKWIRSVLAAVGLVAATLVGVSIQPSWAACGCEGGSSCTCPTGQEDCAPYGYTTSCECGYGGAIGCSNCGIVCMLGNSPCGGTTTEIDCQCGGALCDPQLNQPCAEGYKCPLSPVPYAPCGGAATRVCPCGWWWCSWGGLGSCWTGDVEVCGDATAGCGGGSFWANCDCPGTDCPRPDGEEGTEGMPCRGARVCDQTQKPWYPPTPLWSACGWDENLHCTSAQ